MTTISRSFVAVMVTATFLLVGCGDKDYNVVSVSGKVTCDGSPVPGIQVIFAPQATEENFAPGPWSTGTTNSSGEFTLQTRYKEKGAVVGLHDVAFEYVDANLEDLEELQEDLDEAMDEEEGSPEEVADLKKQIVDMKKLLQSRPRVAEDYTVTFEVPEGGSSAANFDLPGK